MAEPDPEEGGSSEERVDCTEGQVAGQFIRWGPLIDEPMDSEISSSKELEYGPDIQRFLEDAAEATAEFARKAQISVVIPSAQISYTDDRSRSASDVNPVNFRSRVFSRFACCCNARRRPTKFGRETKIVLPKGWKTAPIILGSAIAERLGSTTITYNLIVYLTTEMSMPLVNAVYISTASFSASNLAPLFGEFLADAHLGRFTAVAAGSVFYLGGLVLFNLLVMASGLRPSGCTVWEHNEKGNRCHQGNSLQTTILFLSLLLQALGSGGIRPCAALLGADQFDDSRLDSVHQSQTQNFFNWYKSCMAATTIVAVTVVIWVQTDVSWGWGFLVLSITMGLSLMALLFGSSFFHCVYPNGSSLPSLLRVLIAATRKRQLSLPENPDDLYEVKTRGINNYLLLHSENMRWLDKAAILEEDGKDVSDFNPWRLCPVHQVEELKKILKMTPVWLCGSTSAIVYIQVFTVMTKQALAMDRRLGGLELPAAMVGFFSIATFVLFVPFYNAYLVALLRMLTRHPRGLSTLQRVGVGIFIGILSMAVSAILENKRRAVAISNSGGHQFSAFLLAPQSVLAGLGETFVVHGLLEFFYDEMPSRLQRLHKSFVWAALGMAGILSATLVSILQWITKPGTGEANGWLHDDINRGRVDYFYCTLAVLTILLFTIYVFIASTYTYTVKTHLEPDHSKVDRTGTNTIMDDSL